MGTDASDACPDALNDDAWPPDVNGGMGCGSSHNGEVDILDVLCYRRRLPPNPYDPRYDLKADGGVDILDVLVYRRFLGKTCTNP